MNVTYTIEQTVEAVSARRGIVVFVYSEHYNTEIHFDLQNQVTLFFDGEKTYSRPFNKLSEKNLEETAKKILKLANIRPFDIDKAGRRINAPAI